MTRLTLRLILTLAIALTAAAAAGAGSANAAGMPVTGSTSDGGTFAGTLEVTGFAVENGQLVALGTLSGTVTGANGDTLAVNDLAISSPVQVAQQATCSLARIAIGAIDIEVAGLVFVHIDPIVVDVGLGGLLGSLICGLLGGTTPALPAPPVPAV